MPREGQVSDDSVPPKPSVEYTMPCRYVRTTYLAHMKCLVSQFIERNAKSYSMNQLVSRLLIAALISFQIES